MKHYRNLPRTIAEAKACNWDSRKERLAYLRNRNRASSYIHKLEVRTRIFTRDHYQCVLCGAIEYLTIDHIISILSGGGNNDSNLQTLCRSCNSAKSP